MRILPILFSLGSLFVASCGSFPSEWRRAVSQPIPTDLTGAWEGRWVSQTSGHQGTLRCVVRQDASSAETYHFHYWARWGFLCGTFPAVYPVQAIGPDRWAFSGHSDLGLLGGLYHHRGKATPTTFNATYHSTRGDHGTMQMRRPLGPR